MKNLQLGSFGFARSSGGDYWPTLACGFILAAFLVLTGGCRERPSKEELLRNTPAEMQKLLEPMQSTPLMVEGIHHPKLVTADQAGLDASEEVIGVVVRGQPRAYPIYRLSEMIGHVVNDYVPGEALGPMPFAVTYCDLTDCIRVFAPADGRETENLGLATLGMLDQGLALRWEGKQFRQQDELDGLIELPHTRTTWTAWRKLHPETLVYQNGR
jgi:hypothetical protein